MCKCVIFHHKEETHTVIAEECLQKPWKPSISDVAEVTSIVSLVSRKRTYVSVSYVFMCVWGLGVFHEHTWQQSCFTKDIDIQISINQCMLSW